MPGDEGARRVPLGPIGHYVIDEFKRCLAEQKLTYREVSDRLIKIGRPIPTLGLSRIVNGTRRVDVDDLVALAIALDISPGHLLLPADSGEADEIDLTAKLRLSGHDARQWVAGYAPLPSLGDITWPRSAFYWRAREAELAELRQRIDMYESATNDPSVRQHIADRQARPGES
jgi:transcriptional regulator with XRE-family HTH domain